ncbi:YtxH domain-containing protein [Phormidium sp. FACHB-592]|uniref:Gas vesicle protein n=1 Tax=Stenomitos frigidus AS-A4 TaxID=2933935 RepID=A0ABV0KLR3_9CYAN|nr:YtxH domain-containing protein [Phormidium sp. FACHB-592]MBD2075129.1 YtxH domain-containing protein [Phormidium sp. FACHB-592]
MASSSKQRSTGDETVLDEPARIPYADPDSEITDNGFARVALGVLIGATLGGIAGALTNKRVVDRINRTVKDVGNTVKTTAVSVNDTVQEVGDAVYSVATSVNDTVKDAGGTVKETAEGVSGTVQHALGAIKNTSKDVNGTVQETLEAVKKVSEDINTSAQPKVEKSSGETLYKLVPINSADEVNL